MPLPAILRRALTGAVPLTATAACLSPGGPAPSSPRAPLAADGIVVEARPLALGRDEAPGTPDVRPLATLTAAPPETPRGAAPTTATDEVRPLATLTTWADDVWLDLLDREGTIHGPLAPEGIFQRFHPQMDPEYALDLRTGLFTPAEDAAWDRADEGFRAVGSSISHPHIMNSVQWRGAFQITGALDLTADYRRDHSLTDRRDYPRVGARWGDPAGPGWTVEGRLGVHFLKPATDVELGARRVWSTGAAAGWRTELRVAAVDVFNDVVFVSLGVEPHLVEAHVDHRGLPLAARALIERYTRRWRVELLAGGSTERQAHVTFPRTGSQPFDVRERVAFAGLLAEVRPTDRLAAAAYGRSARADMRHVFPFAPQRDLVVSERTDAAGAYARYELSTPLLLEGELHTVWRPETRTEGGAPALEHDDREVYAGLALLRLPATGWTARLAYGGLDRRAGVLLPDVAGHHHRLVTEAGYRTAAGFVVTAGVRWDLDAIRTIAFDGLLLRMTVLPIRGSEREGG